YGSYLRTPIQILFGSKDGDDSRKCGFWDKGHKTNLKKGQWSLLGGNYIQGENNLHTCSFVHLTHFALLLMSDRKHVESEEFVEEIEEINLEIITIIGCSF